MGIETIAFATLAAVQATSAMSSADAQANAEVNSANLQNQNTARNTNLKAASVQASFLNNGFAMTGTPSLATSDIYNVGRTNIQNTINNANITSKNDISQGRTNAIKGIVADFGLQNLAGSMGSMFDTGTTLGNLVTTNSADVYDGAAVDISKNWVTGDQMVNY